MTKKITDLEGRLDAAFQRSKKHKKMLGSGIICPRCLGPKPKGNCGIGMALSRRGRASICSQCGTEEAMLDYAKGNVPDCVKIDERRLRLALERMEAH